ncbi:MAG: RluA family pseudouridine synthase [Pseudomonadota bacterium]
MTRNRPIPHLTDHDRDYIRGLLVHEDEAILAFNKPSGLPSQVRGNRARNLDHLLWAFAKTNGKRPRLVHRLDVGTSGIILAAQTQPDAAALSNSLQQRDVTKTYFALVQGHFPARRSGTFNDPIARLETDGRSQIVVGHPQGKSAVTRWTIHARAGTVAFIELRPQTGRMHQLRVHLAHHGSPIIGDAIYGGAPGSRLALHAAEISLSHPRSGAPAHFEAPLPDDFKAIAAYHKLDCMVSVRGCSG